MKKFTLILISLCMLFLAGCGNSEIGVHTKVNRNGSIDVKSKIAIADLLPIFQNQNPEIKSNIFSIDGKKGEAKFYREDDKNISEFNYHFKNREELDSLFSKVSSDNVKIQIVKHKGFLFNKYDYTMDVQNALTEDNINNKIGSELKDKGLFLDEAKAAQLRQLIGSSITLSNSLTIPGKITKSNGTYNGGTVTWKYPLSDLKENTQMTATFRVLNPTGVITLAVIFIALVAATITFFLIRKKRNFVK